MKKCRYGDERVPARVWAKLVVDPATGCWLWQGAPTREGYGRVQVAGRLWRVHRYMYSTLVRELGDEEVLDHVCHTEDELCFSSWACPHRLCGNPAHLDPVTGAENSARQHSPYVLREVCPSGHEYDEENTRWYRGMRYCGSCREEVGPEIARRYRERHPERVRDSAARYREEHPERRAATRRAHYEENRARERETHRAWAERNREHRREYMRLYRARRAEAARSAR